MRRLFNFRLVEGDSNVIGRNDVLVTRDNSTGDIKEISKRGGDSDGELKDVVKSDKLTYESIFNGNYDIAIFDSDVKVKEIIPLGRYFDITKFEVKQSDGYYKAVLNFTIVRRGELKVGDGMYTPSTRIYNCGVVYEDDDHPTPSFGRAEKFTYISYNGEMDPEEGIYSTTIMVVLAKDIYNKTVIVATGNLSLRADASKLEQ